MIKHICLTTILSIVFWNAAQLSHAQEEPKAASDAVTRQLDAYWSEVSRSVRDGDYEGYSATCDPNGILVSGIKKSSYPLRQALAGWKDGFEKTRSKAIKASVEFRFSQRLHDTTTAHETGIFRYATEADGESSVQYIHFEGLLRKTDDGWKIVMEYQKSLATQDDWRKLATPKKR